MSEIWDIYDENANLTGRTMKRGIPKPGDYMLCVHIYLYRPDGMFLLQKRSMNKQSHPGEWDVTGGAVLSGEKSIEGAIRETYEEIGILLDESELFCTKRIKRKSNFVDIYFAKKQFEIADCVIQKEEVEEVRFVDGIELIHLAINSRHRDREYIDVISMQIDKILN